MKIVEWCGERRLIKIELAIRINQVGNGGGTFGYLKVIMP